MMMSQSSSSSAVFFKVTSSELDFYFEILAGDPRKGGEKEKFVNILGSLGLVFGCFYT